MAVNNEELVLVKKNLNMMYAMSNKRLIEFNDSVVYTMDNIINLSNIILDDYGICMSYKYFSPEIYCPTMRKSYERFDSKLLCNKLMLIIEFEVKPRKSKKYLEIGDPVFDNFIMTPRNILYKNQDKDLSKRNIDSVVDHNDPFTMNVTYDIVYGNEEYNDFVFYFTNMLRNYFN